jgi:hypothetical protein
MSWQRGPCPMRVNHAANTCSGTNHDPLAMQKVVGSNPIIRFFESHVRFYNGRSTRWTARGDVRGAISPITRFLKSPLDGFFVASDSARGASTLNNVEKKGG